VCLYSLGRLGALQICQNGKVKAELIQTELRHELQEEKAFLNNSLWRHFHFRTREPEPWINKCTARYLRLPMHGVIWGQLLLNNTMGR